MQLHGISKTIAARLARLQLFSITDLLFHLPFRYQNRTVRLPIRQLKIDQEGLVEGIIQDVHTPPKKRTRLLITLSDETGTMQIRFFHAPFFFKKTFVRGNRVRCFGIGRLGQNGLEMIHPDFQMIPSDQPLPLETHLTPIYPATRGLSQKTLRKLIDRALQQAEQDTLLTELIPEAWRHTKTWPTLIEALQWIHHPPRTAHLPQLLHKQTPAHQRLIFEELLAHRVGLLHLKHTLHTQPGIAFSTTMMQSSLCHALTKQLPFTLTRAQQRACEDISHDLMQPTPMLRLLQGDVGSGKTIVAALAILQAVQNGYQAALMTPTELLAEQHYHVFNQWLSTSNISVVFLSSSVKSKERRLILQAIANHTAQIIIGTHALLQKDVTFARLALIVIDEQHRFGVEQRSVLKEKGQTLLPHQLIMTATPIPRTLAMTLYSELATSIINEMPANKATITTSVMANTKREMITERIQTICQQGQQVYWVCPLIETSQQIEAEAVLQLGKQLQKTLKPLQVAVLHGQMRTAEKTTLMKAFQQGTLHVLVATTLIEVGIDVPNASLMIIENAERLGLAQLHQLRGRVGRGTTASHCLLLYQPPLSDIAKSRLQVMRSTQDGFKIAEHDLTLRGPGELLGTRQTGAWSLHIADLMRDHALLAETLPLATTFITHHTEWIVPLMKRWMNHTDTPQGMP